VCILCESKKGVCPSALNAVVGETTDIILCFDKTCARFSSHALCHTCSCFPSNQLAIDVVS
jgi:hypothetical protein